MKKPITGKETLILPSKFTGKAKVTIAEKHTHEFILAHFDPEGSTGGIGEFAYTFYPSKAYFVCLCGKFKVLEDKQND